MLFRKIKFVLFTAMLSFVLVSCSDEDEIVNSQNLITDQVVAEARGGGGPQNGNNGPNDRPNPPNGNLNAASSDIALQWMGLFLELDRYADGMRPNATARALAYINLAAYETAEPAMRDFESNSDKIRGFRLRRSQNPGDINWQLALNACYADVFDHFIINLPESYRVKIESLENALEEDLSNDLTSEIVAESKERGAQVAAAIIEFAQSDSEAEQQILEPQPLSYEPPTGEGYWTYSADPERALFPYWGTVRTFVIRPSQTTTIPPMSYSEDPNSNYYQQMVEVYNANNEARDFDEEALHIAEFWSDDVTTLTFGPPARQISIANQLIQQNELGLAEALHLYLKLGFALNDAAVSTWKYKYEYMVMRPNVFIHEFIDPSYQTNLYRLIPWPNPTFPGYPSGHSCFASAAAGVFVDFFGDATNFTDRSHEGRTEFRGTPRSFTSFNDMAEENGYSRIPLGVHIRMDCTEGLRLGYEISDAVNRYRVRRRPSA